MGKNDIPLNVFMQYHQPTATTPIVVADDNDDMTEREYVHLNFPP